jgi:hypothetical protein
METQRGFIYLLAASTGWFRIGRTVHLKQRFRDYRWLASNNGYEIWPILIIDVCNPPLAERAIHEIYADKRIAPASNLSGTRAEWFDLDESDIAMFRRIAATIGTPTELHGEWPHPYRPYKWRLAELERIHNCQRQWL